MATTLGNGTITFGDGTTLSSGSMINSIQRGTITTNYENMNTISVTISSVNTSKCMVLIDGSIVIWYGGGAVMTTHLSAFNSATQFTIGWNGSTNGGVISWQVIEFK